MKADESVTLIEPRVTVYAVLFFVQLLVAQLHTSKARRKQKRFMCRCLVCLGTGHTSASCPDAEGVTLLFRALSPEHLLAWELGEDLVGHSDGSCLTAGEHVGGGNVLWRSKWFSASRYAECAYYWSCREASEGHTRFITPCHYPHKAVAVLDAAGCTKRYDVHTEELARAAGVTDRWLQVAVDCEEVILERVKHSSILRVVRFTDLFGEHDDESFWLSFWAYNCDNWKGDKACPEELPI